jgi:hypothetical protein
MREPGAASQLPTWQSVRTVDDTCEPIFLTSTRVVPAIAVIDLNTSDSRKPLNPLKIKDLFFTLS